MRRWPQGLLIALVVTSCAIIISYVVLNYFYSTPEREIIWKGVAPMSWENAEQEKPEVFTVENTEYVGKVFMAENVELLAGRTRLAVWPVAERYNVTILTCDDTKIVRTVTPLSWENAEELKTPVLTPSPETELRGAGKAGEDAYYDLEVRKVLPTSGTPVLEEMSGGTTFIIRETKPLAVLPISASIGCAMGFVVLAVWIGHRRTWGDATSMLLEHGLHDMMVRDVEIVGQIIDLKEFTMPELMKLTKTSKIAVWRAVRKLAERGLVQPTRKTRRAANGLGGRGKPSRVYRYIGVKGSPKGETGPISNKGERVCRT